MSKFVRMIGGCFVNEVGFDLYENKDKTVSLRPTKGLSDLPKNYWLKFDNMDEAETYIDSLGCSGASLVQALKDEIL